MKLSTNDIGMSFWSILKRTFSHAKCLKAKSKKAWAKQEVHGMRLFRNDLSLMPFISLFTKKL